MFKKQPNGLYVLALANTGERFGYYTMLAIFLLFLQAKFGFDATISGQIYAGFLAVVYFMPLIGGVIADKWSFSKCVVTGIFVMLFGYLVMSLVAPWFTGNNAPLWVLIGGLFLISCGTGLFKGNLQVMVGDLYNSPEREGQRDSAFSIFYMAINIGSMFAPMMATAMLNVALDRAGFTYNSELPALCNQLIAGTLQDPTHLMELAQANGMAAGQTLSDFASEYIRVISTGYGYGFGVACISLVFSFLVYWLGRPAFREVLVDKKNAAAKAAAGTGPELTPAQTKSRVIALLLVFTVVIFFWMVFHQNGATLTEFAKSCTAPESTGATRIGFNVWALATIAVGVYALFSLFQSKTNKGKLISGGIILAVAVGLYFFYQYTPDPVTGIQPQQYQQFNPFYVVALTPVSLAIFGYLANRKKEPSAPRKIGYGMVMAAVAYGFMMLGSFQLGSGINGAVSPNWLITTYLLLTFAELLLSTMGISFVSKVAPPKLKGSMMGGWFVATAVGNYLVSIPMILWGKIPVWMLWIILAVICLLSAAFIFSIMKKLEAATSDQPAIAQAADGEKVASEVEV